MNNAPRNLYLSKDEHWIGVSTSSLSVAERVMRLVGHPEVIDEPWFASGRTRAHHADLLDEYVGSWIADRTKDDVIEAFAAAGAAAAPIYDVSDLMGDPQYQALDTIITVDDDELGPMKMQNVLFRLSRTPGRVRWSGRLKGADTADILVERLGMSAEDVDALRAKGVL